METKNENKESIIGVRVSNKEKADFYNYALEHNKSMSEIIRDALEKETGIKINKY